MVSHARDSNFVAIAVQHFGPLCYGAAQTTAISIQWNTCK